MSVQERLKRFLETINKTSDKYNDPEMDEGRIRLYRRWLYEIETSIKSLADKLSEKELSVLLGVVEDLFPRKYFAFGTDYGTCYGTRPVLEVLRCLTEQHKLFSEEEQRIAYLSALYAIYKGSEQVQVDPLFHYPRAGLPDNELNTEVASLNQRLRAADPAEILNTPKQVYQRGLMRQFLELGYSVEGYPIKDSVQIDIIIKKPDGMYSGLEASIGLWGLPEPVAQHSDEHRIGNPNILMMAIWRYVNRFERYDNPDEPEYSTIETTVRRVLFNMSPSEVKENKLKDDAGAQKMFEDIQRVTH